MSDSNIDINKLMLHIESTASTASADHTTTDYIVDPDINDQEEQFDEKSSRRRNKSGVSPDPFDGQDFSDDYNDHDEHHMNMKMFVNSLVWLVYALLPLIAIIFLLSNYSTEDIIDVVYDYVSYSKDNNKNDFYKPDLPSTYDDNSHKYDGYKIEFYDLKEYQSTGEGWNNGERILFCVPLRDAAPHLPMFFANLMNLTYPHNLIDIAFLISDTSDSTMKDLKKTLKDIQGSPNKAQHFGRINIYEKDFGQIIGQSFSDRHGFAAQGPRRKLMAIARNWLLTTALRPDHSWVYWRDIDVETVPATVIEDLMHHNKDVIVPNIWRPLPDWLGYEQPYDLNSWQESEGGLDLADKLDEDAVIVEGYAEYATWRPHLAYMRDPFGDPEVEMELDGIGGVSILAKGQVFKNGALFPAFSYLKHAETEGFGKLCKTMNYSVIGLPHYTIWHIYEPSSDDLRHMEWMAKEEKNKLEKARSQKIYNKIWTKAFERVDEEWETLKFNVFKNSDLRRPIDIDWSEVDEYLEASNEDELSDLDSINKRHGEIFGSFPLNSYIDGKHYKFVKFKDINSNAKEEDILAGAIEDTQDELAKEREQQAKDVELEKMLQSKLAKEKELAELEKKFIEKQERKQKQDQEQELARLREKSEEKRIERSVKKRKQQQEKEKFQQVAVQKEMERRKQLGLNIQQIPLGPKDPASPLDV